MGYLNGKNNVATKTAANVTGILQEDEVISFDELCTRGLDVIITKKDTSVNYSTTKMKGVSWDKKNKKWVSYYL